ncbi:MAG: glycogen/starch synthase, partial [Verrucomicrobia bacterium]|nr:glycogen/starch synthase [Verrucomicrobiota bacterium]
MKILFVVADPRPLFLPDSASRASARLPALCLELQRAGHEVSIVSPYHAPSLANVASGSGSGGGVGRAGAGKIKPTGVTISFPLGARSDVAVETWEVRAPQGLQVFLLKSAGYFEGPDAPIAEHDLAAGALFAKAVVELTRRLNPAPDVVQAHDWPGALALVLLRAARLPFSTTLVLPADLRAQGSFPVEDFNLLNLGWEWFTPAGMEFYGRLNCLKAGIVVADALVADGEGDRRAVQTPAGGGGLDAVLREHAGRLHGIIDGLDEAAWNPSTDKLLPRKYRPAALGGKRTSANVFLASLGLKKAPVGPVFTLTRPAVDGTAPLEGLEQLAPILNEILNDDARLIVAGGPAPDPSAAPERALALAAKRFPEKVALVRDPADLDERFERSLLAAADFTLVLGRGRGVGAGVLRALRYGVVPIVPAGTGLETLVDDYRPGANGAGVHGHALYYYSPTTD